MSNDEQFLWAYLQLFYFLWTVHIICLFFIGWVVFHCILYHIFIHSSVCEHLNCFHVLAIVSTAAVKKLVFQIQGQRFGLRFRVRVPTQWGNGDPRKSNAVLSCFSHVWLFSTPWTVTHQAPLAMGFPRQEYWGGLPFPPPGDLPNPGIEPTSPALAGSSWL